MIAEGFAREIEVTEGGIKRKCSVLEAILMQLSAKAAKQEKRALRVLMQYQDFSIGTARKILLRD